ncbi:class I SAM-dependent methyltransferase [Gracilimonas tropica]|uniref:class I SAM-dependent methyltransferase n=1 Tax=Gracilimonas tropica TaxID=454600 RepID=UPI0003668F39|nr:class I SAM-dependent methyltransferase [Gracilimonas tropica]
MIHFINDWFFRMVDRYMDIHYGDRKRKLMADHPETVVEIGAAYGANFRYLRPGTKVIAIEPKKSFNDLLMRRAKHYGIEVEIHNYGAETMNLKSESVEMVIGSLVLCTAKSPVKVLFEVRRVLKEGGKYVFIEHVKADKESWICKVQHSIKTPWKWFFDGCHVTRQTGRIIQNALFSSVELEEFDSKTVFIPIIPHVSGTAIK